MADIWDEAEVLSLVNSITNDPPFLERDAEYANQRDLLFQRRFVGIPGVTIDANGKFKEGMVQFRSPEIEDSVHSFKNRMLAAPIRIKAAARSKSDKAVAAAQAQQNYFNRLFDRWLATGVFDRSLFDQAAHGVGWLHLALNTELLPITPEWQEGGDAEVYLDLVGSELEKFTSGEKPDLFVLDHIDPSTMYWSPDRSIRVQKALVPLNPLVQQYGNKGKQIYLNDQTGNIEVTTLDPGQNVRIPRAYWARQITLYTIDTPDYCYHAVFNNRSITASQTGPAKQGSVLGVYRNLFKVPTFFPIIGEETGDPRPLYRYRGMVFGKYQTVPVKNVIATAMTTQAAESAQQRYALKWIGQGPPPEDMPNTVIEIQEDGVVIPPPGYEFVNSGMQTGPDLGKALQYINSVDTYGYPKALNQPEEVSASSGYDRARQQDAVASLLDPPLGHWATALTDVFAAVKNAMVEIDTPITVRATQGKAGAGRQTMIQTETTINPDDIKVETDLSVSFNSTTIFSRIAMEEEGMKEMQADMMHETEFLSDVRGVDDVPAWRDQRALDKVLKASEDQAVADAIKAIQSFAAAVEEKAVQDNKIPVPTPVTPPMVQTNAGALRSDRGPAVPVGPGQSMPATGPVAPQAAELGAPEVTNQVMQ